MRTHTLKAMWRTILTMVSIGLGSSVVLTQQQPSIGQVTALQGQATGKLLSSMLRRGSVVQSC
jgi:hypothetical protein